MEVECRKPWTHHDPKKGRSEVLKGIIVNVTPDHLAKGLIKLGWGREVHSRL